MRLRIRASLSYGPAPPYLVEIALLRPVLVTLEFLPRILDIRKTFFSFFLELSDSFFVFFTRLRGIAGTTRTNSRVVGGSPDRRPESPRRRFRRRLRRWDAARNRNVAVQTADHRRHFGHFEFAELRKGE